MSGILAALAIADILLFIASAVLGLLVADERFYPEHLILALFTALLTMLIHAALITYFSVTGRMMSQAIFIGHLDRTPLEQIRRSKGRLIKYVVPSILTTVFVVAVGALSARDHNWHSYHLAAAAVAILVSAAAFYAEYGLVVENATLMSDVFAQYQAKRSDRPPLHPAP